MAIRKNFQKRKFFGMRENLFRKIFRTENPKDFLVFGNNVPDIKRGDKIAGKKGVSPIISTILLIMIVVIIAIIIFLWSRKFIEESILKEIAGDTKRVEDFCLEVGIEPILNQDGTFGFRNTGNVPIYAVNLKLVDSGNSRIISIEPAQGGANPGISRIIEGYDNNHDGVMIIPILLGKSESGEIKEFPCPERNGIEI